MLPETKQAQIEYIDTSALKFAPFNPPSRTKPSALKALRGQIERAGTRIISPLTITTDNYVADGHRRLTLAREMGINPVPCIRESMTLFDLWAILNSGTLAPKPRTWMEAVAEGMPIEALPDKERRQVTELRRIMGVEYFTDLARSGRSPYILNMAQWVARYCADESDKFIKATILWFEEFEQQFATRTAIREKCPPEVLTSAITEKRPIRQYWGVS